MRKKWTIFGVSLSLILFTSAVTIDTDKYFEIAKNLEIFTSIYKELNANYVDDLDPNTVMRTGIDAMMDKLDPYTVYYSESQVESYRIALDNKYDGLGIDSKDVDGKATITEIYKGGPSDEAGLEVGDQIISINGKSTKNKSYEDIIAFMRGFPGTSLALGVRRPSEKKDLNVNIVRSEVAIPNVPYSGMVSDHVGYITLTTFTRDAGKNIAKALRQLRQENQLNGLILDLRNNGGGLLAEAIDILGIFLPKGSPVVDTKGKVRERDQNYGTRRTPIDIDLPVIVLINKSSASASEIVSGAIQDYDRGVIMGQRSYGKGLVQNTKEVGYNSRIKLTTSKYYIPSGRCIQSVAYDNGEPKDIPDDQREVFKTKNGRPVLDGGGVTPDVKLPAPVEPDVLKTLKKDNWVFKYVNDYIEKQPEQEDMKALTFDNYDGFLTYLSKNKFDFKTASEEALAKFLDETKTDQLIKSEVQSIQAKVAKDKADDLTQYKEAIVKNIEIELAKRYFFQEGKAYQRLKNDSEIEAAIALLNNPSEYAKLLQ